MDFSRRRDVDGVAAARPRSCFFRVMVVIHRSYSEDPLDGEVSKRIEIHPRRSESGSRWNGVRTKWLRHERSGYRTIAFQRTSRSLKRTTYSLGGPVKRTAATRPWRSRIRVCVVADRFPTAVALAPRAATQSKAAPVSILVLGAICFGPGQGSLDRHYS
jgi:hypothetical protein